MPGWKVSTTLTVQLPSDIADGLWVQIQHPKMLPLSTMKKFMALAPKSKDEDGLSHFDLDGGRELAEALILDWNLPDADGSGKMLQTPSKDPDVWERIPAMAIITAIFGVLGEGVVQAQPDPN